MLLLSDPTQISTITDSCDMKAIILLQKITLRCTLEFH